MTTARKIDQSLLETAANWATRRAEGTLTPAEEIEFEDWLNASPLHAEALEQVDVSWFALADAANAPELLAMRAAALDRSRRANRARWAHAAFSTRARVAAMAAVMLIAVIGGGLAWRLTPHTYETGIAERQAVVLADGSRVSLDADTQVRVRLLSNRRELWLERGRAKFDVAHDPLRPFTVTAAGRTVIATGTSFSVELVNREMRVILYDGSVSVLDAPRQGAPQQPLIVADTRQPAGQTLTPGRELVAELGAASVVVTSAVDPMRSRAWEGGQLVFDEEPLAVAIARLNRHSTERIIIGDDLTAEMRVNGVFNAGDTDAFIDAATTLLPLRVTRRRNEIVLSTDPESFSRWRTVNSPP